MSSPNSNNIYAVCIKKCELIDQMEQTIKTTPASRLLVGDLVQIYKVYRSDCNRCIIQIFDRETQCFRQTLYCCEKDNLCEILSNKWPFIRTITESSVVKVRMALSGGQKVIVNLQVNFFGEIPAGGDQFYGLQMMLTPNLTRDNITELNKTYFSPTLSLIILRADRLILNLVVNDETDEPTHVEPETHRTEKTIYLSDPDKKAYDFLLLPFSNINPTQSQAQTVIPNSIRQKINIRTSNLSDEQGCMSADTTSSNKKIFILPQLPEYEKDCNAEIKTSRKIQRQSTRECKNMCFDCQKKEDALIQFNCQHIFCSECLLKSLNVHDTDNLYCPYKKLNYNCRYKVTVDDIQNIKDIAKGKLFEKYDSMQPKTILHTCIRCQFITITEERNVYQCTNCKRWNNLNVQNDIEVQETSPSSNKTVSPPPPPPSPPPPTTTRTLSWNETWSCSYCDFNENRIDSTICVICSKTNVQLLPQSTTNNYYELLELEGNDTFMPNINQFDCAFCDQTIAHNNGVLLRSCLHNICLNCIVVYIKLQDQVEIKCPHTICTYSIQHREIKSLITQDVYTNLIQKTLQIGKMNLENGYQCCIPDCDGFWVFDDINVKYVCPKCNNENCIPCKASHPGIECSVFKAQPK